MASMLYCPECGEIIGKDTECSALEYCGTCGEDNIYNERGETEDLTEEELAYVRKKKRRTGRIISRYR
jgi:hypothetical protein